MDLGFPHLGYHAVVLARDVLRGTGRRPLVPALALVISASGLALLWLQVAAGAALVLLGMAMLLAVDRRWFVLTTAMVLPISTVGWPSPIAVIDGRTLDARLVLTFGIAALGMVALATDRRRISRSEALMFAILGYIVIVGVLRSDSYLTWAPPAARWTAFLCAFVLARRHLGTLPYFRWLAIAIVAGFSVPVVAGVAQFLLGAAGVQNEAIRATGLDASSPVALAFAGQMALVGSVALLATTSYKSPFGVFMTLVAILSTFAIVASATRLVLVTAWAALSAFAGSRRRWAAVALFTVILAASLALRPDFVGRFVGTVTPATPSPAEPASTPAPNGPVPRGGSEVGDPSLRFRIFVWRVLYEAWRDEPILGIGPGMTARAVASVSPARRTAPHNDYIGTLAELGVVGLAGYLTLQVSVLWGIWRRFQAAGSEQEASLRLLVLVAFTAFNVLGVLNNPIYFLDIQFALWALAGSALAIWHHQPVRATTARASS
jgi:O-antigen ligase